MLVDILIRRAAMRIDHVDMDRSAKWNCTWSSLWRRASSWRK
ncbi:hypothetical protein [Lutibaculum baratangense]|nr:hypothetical protein [Lutibaculum baratangense]